MYQKSKGLEERPSYPVHLVKLPSTSKLLKHGRIAGSVKSQNHAVSSWLPAQYTGYCQAVAEYIRYLLGVTDVQPTWPPSPTTAEISHLPEHPDDAITNDKTVFNSNIFSPATQRWVRGRAQDIAKMARNPNMRQTRRKSDRKRTLFEYRKSTIKQHLGEHALLYLPNVDCCSDTEDDEDGNVIVVDSLWREERYREFLHTVDKLSIHYAKETQGARSAAQRLDSRRQPSTRVDERAAVAPNLPKQCYREEFYSNLRQTERYLITVEGGSESLESLLAKARALSK
ncbi:uncharacterized protein MELLADRAFT_113989 [Melampsora larici-populina 98AG31]|uniref:Uncharacterized protein n=1 Tax=Melampsora larici-populina (strain 98AG31 / pathotype 3-4-7) TaxID=747676 RepID=F4SBR9_MELLP|nr:uncharacterized protein MELLADRAFT_113989 [Melampsora larici-populina 98AG31]EGF97919.1 hypothetical protein MELLADRAFT_113989 [Melampsora larici-populina 98AG31]